MPRRRVSIEEKLYPYSISLRIEQIKLLQQQPNASALVRALLSDLAGLKRINSKLDALSYQKLMEQWEWLSSARELEERIKEKLNKPEGECSPILMDGLSMLIAYNRALNTLASNIEEVREAFKSLKAVNMPSQNAKSGELQ